MKNQSIIIGVIVGLGVIAAPAAAQDALPRAVDGGFYGGVALRDRGADGPGVTFGAFTSAWTKFSPATLDDSGVRALAFGGYRWRNDLAIEAAVARTDNYALRPAGGGARSGVGLALQDNFDARPKGWNVDVYGTYTLYKSFALYGRLGYAQAESAAVSAALPVGDPRRTREGMNYGVGLRYDMTSALGLKVEYARFGRAALESFSGPLPESDQLQFGVQYRF